MSKRAALVTATYLVLLASNKSASASGREDSTDPSLYYETINVLPLMPLDVAGKKIDTTTTKWLDVGLQFDINGMIYADTNGALQPLPANNTIYYIIHFIGEKDKIHTTNDGYIQGSDHDKSFAVIASDFDSHVASGDILRLHGRRWLPTVRFGASLTLPFKLRRATDKHPRDLTTDASVAGYLGFRWRIARAHDYFVSTVVGFGFSLLPATTATTSAMNMDNKQNQTTLLPGITLCLGVIAELDKFQLGFLMGKDFASGTGDATWAYDNEWWYAIGLGFTFFGIGTQEQHP